MRSPLRVLYNESGSIKFNLWLINKGGRMSATPKEVRGNITFRNTDGTEPLKNYATEKIGNCIQKFTHHDTEAHVVLTVEKNRQIAEISCLSNGKNMVAKEETPDLYTSIDAAVHALSGQLRKHKEKITSKH